MNNNLEQAVKEHELCLEKIKAKEEIMEAEQTKVENLYDKQKELGRKILEKQVNGSIIENPALDYCFRHFSEKIYEHLELVNEFKYQVKQYFGQKILTVRENEKLDLGIISGECIFEVDKSFRYLYVPVKDLKTFGIEEGYTGNWEKGGDKIWIESDIFDTKKIRFRNKNPEKSELLKKFPELLKKSKQMLEQTKNFGEYWNADYSKQICIGGPCPNNWHVYIGNGIVEHNLEKYLEMDVPSTRIVIPHP
ncbi:MAG: hypothetical protein KJ646_02860 [Nanoarchaeota archaeon]|nr:hypothetical protein [Nanoarchaeota archaeon]